VGSLIGKTEEVDMKYTQEKGVVRARVSCLNPVEIPQSVSHYYDGEGYNIEFVIESVDGETIADENQGENGEDDSENKENDSKSEPSKEAQEDANKEGRFSSAKRNVGSDPPPPPPSDHEVVNSGSLLISYSPWQ
jgi:hypothetical protein